MGLGAPYIADGTLYISASSDNAYIYALDPATGAIQARYQLGGNAANLGVDSTGARGVLYAAFGNDLYAFRTAGGAQIWHTQISNQQNFNAPVLSDGVLYISSSHISEKRADEPEDSYAYAFNISTGAKIWQSIDMTGFVLDAPTVSNGVVYSGLQNGYAYAFSAKSGKLLRRINTGGAVNQSPVVEGGIVYIGHATNSPDGGITSGGILAWNAASDVQRWSKPIPYYMGDTPLIVQNGVVYASTMGFVPSAGRFAGIVYALNASSGAIMWQFHGAGFFPPQVTVIPA